MAYEFHTHLHHYNFSRVYYRITPMGFLKILISLFYSLVQPCKKYYMNVIECLLYCMAGVVLTLIMLDIYHNTILAMVFAADRNCEEV